jgi:hypothetical protein
LHCDRSFSPRGFIPAAPHSLLVTCQKYSSVRWIIEEAVIDVYDQEEAMRPLSVSLEFLGAKQKGEKEKKKRVPRFVLRIVSNPI